VLLFSEICNSGHGVNGSGSGKVLPYYKPRHISAMAVGVGPHLQVIFYNIYSMGIVSLKYIILGVGLMVPGLVKRFLVSNRDA
jgi:hypothetical protein